jgi:hypothetical protein
MIPINKNTAPSRAGRMMLQTSTSALAATASRKRTKSWLLALIAALGLAVFSSFALAQQQRGVDIGTPSRFQIWRMTTLGSHKGVDSYRDALDVAGIKIGDAADEILGRPAFPYVRSKTDVELTLVSAADLGVESKTALADVYKRAKQFGLALCPAEVGAQLRLDYRDQPRGESLNVAMEPVATYSGERTILSLVNFGSGLALVGSNGRSDFMVPRYFRFVFALPGKLPLEARRDPQ